MMKTAAVVVAHISNHLQLLCIQKNMNICMYVDVNIYMCINLYRCEYTYIYIQLYLYTIVTRDPGFIRYINIDIICL